MKIPPEHLHAVERGTHFQGVDKASAGYKLLSGMGWKEGEGLGAQKQGMASHVKVCKKSDNSGVGVAQEARRARDWTIGMTAYESVLAALKPMTESQDEKRSKKRKRKRDKGADEPSKELVSEEKSSDGCANKREKKEKRKKKASETKEAQTTGRTEAQGPVEVTVKQVSHAGRFQKRVKNKMVTGYSSTDLSAILGERLAEQAETPQVDAEACITTGKKGCIVEISVEPNNNDPEAEASQDSNLAETGPMWWHSYFMQAGGVGGHDTYQAFKSTKREVKAAGFSEQDQANLWHNVTDTQNKNRHGLGQGSGSLKVGGAKWQGTRTLIQDGDGEGAEKSLQSGGSEQLPVATLDEDTSTGSRKRAKKLVRQMLSAAENQEMRLKEFKVKLAKELASQHGTATENDVQSILAKLGQSRQFVVTKKRISLSR